MKKYFMKQCVLEKSDGEGVVKTTTWLPETFAEVGRCLKLKDNGVWNNGWKVVSVGSYRMEAKEAEEMGWRHTKQRRASDRLRSDKVE
jgi:hypothetical protein